MPKQYKIREGFSFIDPQSGKVVAGEIIALDDDVAAKHLHKLEPMPVQTSAQRKPAKLAPDAVKAADADKAAEGPAPAAEPAPEPDGAAVDADAGKAE